MGQTQGQKAQRMQALSQSSDYETHLHSFSHFQMKTRLYVPQRKK